MRREDALIIELSKKNRDDVLITSLIHSELLDWHYFFATNSKHLIAPIIYSRLLCYPLPECRMNDLKSQAGREIVTAAFHNKVFKTELDRIFGVFKEDEIDCILVKGLSLDYFEPRRMTDIDILIRKDTLLKAIESLRRIGYRFDVHSNGSYLKRNEKNNIEHQFSWNSHYQFYNEEMGVLLELHTNLFQRDRVYVERLDSILDNIDLFWRDRQYNSKLNCYVLSSEHALLLMCLHNAIKRSPANSKFLLRQLVDIDNLIAGGIDWQKFTGLSILLKCSAFIYFSLLLARRLLDSEVPEEVLCRLKSRCSEWQLFLTRIHLKCTAISGNSPRLYSVLYRVLKPFVFGKSWKDRIKWIFLLPLLFPSKERMAQIFNLRWQSPLFFLTYLINPFRCIYLVFRDILRS